MRAGSPASCAAMAKTSESLIGLPGGKRRKGIPELVLLARLFTAFIHLQMGAEKSKTMQRVEEAWTTFEKS